MKDGSFVASDVTAIIPYTNRYFVIPEYQIVTLRQDGISVQDLNGNPVEPEMLEVSWNVEAAKKNGYPHYMLKEIHEQPDALRNTITPRLNDGLPDFSEDGIPDRILSSCDKIAIVACGTAMYAGMVGKALIEPIIKIPVSVNIASEFRYENPLVDEKTLVIVISQSGENDRYAGSSETVQKMRRQGSVDCECERFHHCEGKQLCLLYSCRSGNRSRQYKGLYGTAGKPLSDRMPDRHGPREIFRIGCQDFHQPSYGFYSRSAERPCG